METRRMWPEVIIGGFLWMLVFLSLLNLSYRCTPEDAWLWMISIPHDTGILTLLSAGVLAISYFFGSLANRILSPILTTIEKKFRKGEPILLINIFHNAALWELTTYEDRYSTKLMFRSVLVALIVLFPLNINWIFSSDHAASIVSIFLGLTALIAFAFWKQKKFHKEFHDELTARAATRPSSPSSSAIRTGTAEAKTQSKAPAQGQAQRRKTV